MLPGGEGCVRGENFPSQLATFPDGFRTDNLQNVRKGYNHMIGIGMLGNWLCERVAKHPNCDNVTVGVLE